MTGALRLKAALPDPFLVVPPRHSESFDEWVAHVSAPRAVTPLIAPSTIERDLAALAAAMDGMSEEPGQWFVVIPEDPHQHGIRGAGWISASVVPADLELDLAESPAVERWMRGDHSIGAQAEIRRVGQGDALVIHHFQPVGDPSDSTRARLVERCAAIMRVRDPDAVVQIEIFAFDLKTFEDVVDAAVAILASVSIDRTVA